ncbi:MAG: hypothetical protein O9293_13285 [Porphyrobacter sp.]|nr:hypothetical protein [Porphyrobacter sp.]
MPGNLAEASGSQSEAFALSLFKRAVETIWVTDRSNKMATDEALQAALDALRGIRPRDEAEGMLAAQMVATHHAAMECMRRANLPDQSMKGIDLTLKHAVRLMSLYERQLAALDKRRGKGRQKITVEHITVQAGGQAIVGDVNKGQAAPPSPATAVPPMAGALGDDSAASADGEELSRALKAKPAKSPRKRRD